MALLHKLVTGFRRAGEELIDRYSLWEVSIDGIEVTQAIQHYKASKHLTDPDDQGTDNSVYLAAYKSAYVRVYVRAGLYGEVHGVTGKLELARRNQAMGYDVITTYDPVNGPVTAHQVVDYGTERNALWRTLNFVVPADQMRGTLRLTAHLTSHDAHEHSVVVNARLIQTLRVRGILIHYQGPSSANPPPPGGTPITPLDLAAPTLGDLQTTAGMSLAAMPVQATGSFASAGSMNWFTALDDPRLKAGACSSNWSGLLGWLNLMRDNDGNRSDVVYYGLLPAAVPVDVPGCGREGLGAGRVGFGLNMLHEIGHGYGFDHTPCGDAGDTDPNYPTYEPHPSASIGEFGLDIRRGDIYDPSMTGDYMSYCPTRWMSLYQHDRLNQHPRLTPEWIRETSIFDEAHQHPFDLEHLWWPDPPWLAEELRGRLRSMVAIQGEVAIDGSITVTSVARIRVEGWPQGQRLGWEARLVGDEGRPIARAPIYRLDHQGSCGCGHGHGDDDPLQPPFLFKAYIPDDGPGAAIQVTADEDILWERRAPKTAPRVAGVEARIEDGFLALTWQADSTSEPDLWARWSKDVGAIWHSLAVGLSGGRALLPLHGIPNGVITVRLLVHDGFFTAESEPVAVEIPVRDPEVTILHPANGQLVPAHTTIQFAGNAVEPDGMPVDGEHLEWVVDGERVGSGREVWSSGLEPGDHEVTLSIMGSGEVSARFTARGADEPTGE